jgi:uncharacterized protein involved in exopolysaccharide biosynthesis
MTERLLPPAGEDRNESLVPVENQPVYAAQSPGLEPEEEQIPWSRYLSAVSRFKWVMAGVLVLGLLGASLAFRAGSPVFTAQGSLWIKTDASRAGAAGGPIEAGGLLRQAAWLDLLRSGQVLDTVAVRAPACTCGLPPEQDPPALRDLLGRRAITAREPTVLDVSSDGSFLGPFHGART